MLTPMLLFIECKYWQARSFPWAPKALPWVDQKKQEDRKRSLFSSPHSAVLHSKSGPFPNLLEKDRIKSQIKAYLTSFYLKLQSRSFTQGEAQGRRKRKPLTYKRGLDKRKTQVQMLFSPSRTLPSIARKNQSQNLFCCYVSFQWLWKTIDCKLKMRKEKNKKNSPALQRKGWNLNHLRTWSLDRTYFSKANEPRFSTELSFQQWFPFCLEKKKKILFLSTQSISSRTKGLTHLENEVSWLQQPSSCPGVAPSSSPAAARGTSHAGACSKAAWIQEIHSQTGTASNTAGHGLQGAENQVKMQKPMAHAQGSV